MRVFWLFLYYGLIRFLPSRAVCPLCVKLRGWVLRKIFLHVGRNVNVASNVRFGNGALVSIGDNSGIGENGYLVAMERITIGNDVMIAPDVMILTGGHSYDDPSKKLREQPSITKPVIIGNDVWIGSRAIILPGVKIADRTIVAAGSVVVREIEESGVYAGNPAKKIKDLPKS